MIPVVNYPSSSIASRSKAIARAISELEGDSKDLHLVALSTAGVDANVAIGHLGVNCKSLTTIGAPHRGSRMAEWAASQSVDYRLLGNALPMTGLGIDSFVEFTSDNLELTPVPQREEVNYFSIGASVAPENLNHTLFFSEQVLANDEEEIDNDHDGMFMVREVEFGNYLVTFNLCHNDYLGNAKSDYWKNVYRLAADNIIYTEDRERRQNKRDS
jgi:hypothetical protein